MIIRQIARNFVPKFTVIIPVYNVDPYIGECLASVSSQSLRDFEAILVDDGSSDQSAEKCMRWTESDPRFVLLTQENSGPNVARNLALTHAKGDFVIFLDADDKLDSQALQVIAESGMQLNPDMIHYGFDFFDTTTGKIRKRSSFRNKILEGQSIFEEALKGREIVGVCWNKAIRREFLTQNQIRFTPDKMHARDILFTRQCAKAALRTVIISDVLYHSRFRDQSFSRSFSSKNVESAIDLGKKHQTLFQDAPADGIRTLVDYAIGKHLRYILTLSAFRSGNFSEFVRNISLVKNSEFWTSAVGSEESGVAYFTRKDQLLTMLISKPYLFWTICRILNSLDIQPY